MRSTTVSDAGLAMREDKPIALGAPYSVYVRTVRLALEEKGVMYGLGTVDIFSSRSLAKDEWEKFGLPNKQNR